MHKVLVNDLDYEVYILYNGYMNGLKVSKAIYNKSIVTFSLGFTLKTSLDLHNHMILVPSYCPF